MRRALATVLAIAILALAGGCSKSSEAPQTPAPDTTITSDTPSAGQPRLRTIIADINGFRYTLEVADDPAERTSGLGGREGLDDYSGMLFVWDEVAPRELWMKGMRFPLDFVWLDEEKRVVRIEANVVEQPGASDSDLVRYPSGSPVKYVIELGAGAVAPLGLHAGDVVEFNERVDTGTDTPPTPTPQP